MPKTIQDLFQNDEAKTNAFDFIFENYFKSGFGALQKSDINTLILATVLRYGNLEQDELSPYELSKLLKITQRRIMNMKEKVDLLFPPEAENLFELLLSRVKFAEIDENNRYLSIAINDRTIFNELEHIVEGKSSFVITTLNPKVFKVKIQVFLDIMVDLASTGEKSEDEIKENYLEIIRQSIADENELGEKLKEITIFKKDVNEITWDDLKVLVSDFGREMAIEVIYSLGPFGKALANLMRR